jgi:hypothetical protein
MTSAAPNGRTHWDETFVDRVRALHVQQKTFREIGAALGVSPHVVSGIVRRSGLVGRGSPILPGKAAPSARARQGAEPLRAFHPISFGCIQLAGYPDPSEGQS